MEPSRYSRYNYMCTHTHTAYMKAEDILREENPYLCCRVLKHWSTDL